MPDEQLDTPKSSSNLLDLALYIAGGVGILFLVTTIAGLFIHRLSIWVTLAAGLLNALFLIGSVYLLGIRRGKTNWVDMGLLPINWQWRWLWMAVGITLLFIPLRTGITLAAQMLIEGSMDSILARGDLFSGGAGFSWSNFGISLLSLALIAPISEEVYFRGLIHRWFQPRMAFWPRVLTSSALFGLAHFDSVGVVLSSFILGIVNAIAYEKSKSLWPPILIHGASNSIAVITLYINMAVGG